MPDFGRPHYTQPDGRPVYLVAVDTLLDACPATAPAIAGYERVGCDGDRGRGTGQHAEYWRPVQRDA